MYQPVGVPYLVEAASSSVGWLGWSPGVRVLVLGRPPPLVPASPGALDVCQQVREQNARFLVCDMRRSKRLPQFWFSQVSSIHWARRCPLSLLVALKINFPNFLKFRLTCEREYSIVVLVGKSTTRRARSQLYTSVAELAYASGSNPDGKP